MAAESDPCAIFQRSKTENVAIFSRIVSLLTQICGCMTSSSDRLASVDISLPVATRKPSPFTKQPRPPLECAERSFTKLWRDLAIEAVHVPTLATLLETDFVSRLALVEDAHTAMWRDIEAQYRCASSRVAAAAEKVAASDRAYRKCCDMLTATERRVRAQPKLRLMFADLLTDLKPVQVAAAGALGQLNETRQELLPTFERLGLDIERVEQNLFEEIDKAFIDLADNMTALVASYDELLEHLSGSVAKLSSRADVEASIDLPERPGEAVTVRYAATPFDFDLTSQCTEAQLKELFGPEVSRATAEVRGDIDGCAIGERITVLSESGNLLTVRKGDGTTLSVLADKVEITFRRKFMKLSQNFECLKEGERVLVIESGPEASVCMTELGDTFSIPVDKLVDL
jgi:hypothetical protein